MVGVLLGLMIRREISRVAGEGTGGSGSGHGWGRWC